MFDARLVNFEPLGRLAGRWIRGRQRRWLRHVPPLSLRAPTLGQSRTLRENLGRFVAFGRLDARAELGIAAHADLCFCFRDGIATVVSVEDLFDVDRGPAHEGSLRGRVLSLIAPAIPPFVVSLAI